MIHVNITQSKIHSGEYEMHDIYDLFEEIPKIIRLYIDAYRGNIFHCIFKILY